MARKEVIQAEFVVTGNIEQRVNKIISEMNKYDSQASKTVKVNKKLNNSFEELELTFKEVQAGNLRKFNSGIKKYIDNSGKATKNTKSMTSSLKTFAGIAATSFATKKIADFVGESAKLAAEGAGIERAFERIGDLETLQGLRDSVKGTVSDVQLMQQAVQASNFKIPLERLGTFFQFATKRAQETGESVDHLVDSVIRGIGKRSPEVIDNLGISMRRLKEQMGGVSAESATVTDLVRAFGVIAEEELGNMGEIVEDTKISYQQMNAEIKNLKTEIGKELIPAQRKYFVLVRDTLRDWKSILSTTIGTKKEIERNTEINAKLSKDIAETRKNREKELEFLTKQLATGQTLLGINGKSKKLTEEQAKDLTRQIENLQLLLDADKKKLNFLADENKDLTTKKKIVKSTGEVQKTSLEILKEETEEIQTQIENLRRSITLDRERNSTLQKEADQRAKIFDFIRKSELELLSGKDKEKTQARESFQDIIDLTKEGTAERFLLEENLRDQLLQIDKKYLDKKTEEEDKARQLSIDNAKKQREEEIADLRDSINTSVGAYEVGYSIIDSIVSNSIQNQMNSVNSKYEDEEDRINNSNRNEKEKAKLLEKLEKDKRKAQHEIELKKWKADIASSLSNTAVSVTRTAASVPYPANIPLSILAGAQGLVQTGIISGNKPKLAKGGLLSGAKHSSGGIDIEAEDGEFVVNARDTARNLPALRAINSGRSLSNTLNFSPQTIIQGNATPQAVAAIEDSNYRLAREIEKIIQNNGFDSSIVNTGALAV